MTNLASYLAALFNPGEQLACANALEDCRAESQALVLEKRPQWVSVNPFKIWKANKNVTAYRNLVIEYDKGLTVDEQLPFIIDKGFPFTTAVFSGNKSIHVVCALSEPIADYDTFVEVRRRLDIIFPGADRSMKDPARFTRSPDGVNLKTGVSQELVMLNRRVSPSRLASFLARHDALITAHDEAEELKLAARAEIRERGEISESSWRFLRGEEGVKEGMSRHTRLYAIVCDLCDVVGMDYKDALQVANECADLQGITASADRAGEADKIVYDVYFKRRG